MAEPEGFSQQAPLAVVTGASSGIGRAIAPLLAQRGYRTILIARRRAPLEQLAAQLSPSAPSTAVTLDLADPEVIEPTVRQLLREHGQPELLINNAGFGIYKPFVEHSLEDHRALMQVNYLAPLMLIRTLLPGMLQRGRGQVINIASMSSKMGPWGHAGYAATKAALVSLTQTLAAEHQGSDVHFSYVNLGIVDTDYFKGPTWAPVAARYLRRAVALERVAVKIVGLLDRPQLELCVPRHYRMLDLVRALSPTWAMRLVASQSRPLEALEPVDPLTAAHGAACPADGDTTAASSPPSQPE